MPAPVTGLPRALRDHYYGARYWCSDDLWTSFQRIAAGHPHVVAFIEGERSITSPILRSRPNASAGRRRHAA